jgi:hypothetical protein
MQVNRIKSFRAENLLIIIRKNPIDTALHHLQDIVCKYPANRCLQASCKEANNCLI